MFSCVSVCVLTYYFYVFYREKGGGGVLDLVYGPSSSLGMNCEVNFVCCYTDSPISGFTQCSCVDVSSLDLVIHGCTLCGSSSSRMSTRRLPIMLFVSRFECTLYPVFIAWCVYGGRGGLLLICAFRRINI